MASFISGTKNWPKISINWKSLKQHTAIEIMTLYRYPVMHTTMNQCGKYLNSLNEKWYLIFWPEMKNYPIAFFGIFSIVWKPNNVKFASDSGLAEVKGKTWWRFMTVMSWNATSVTFGQNLNFFGCSAIAMSYEFFPAPQKLKSGRFVHDDRR